MADTSRAMLRTATLIRLSGTAVGWITTLCACTSPLPGAPAPAAVTPVSTATSALAASTTPTTVNTIAAITAITLERHGFGLPSGSILELRRDGSAAYTTTGSERAGTADRIARGTVTTADFDALARLASTQGFFGLDDLYEDPEIKDGPWTTTRVTRGGRDKQVFRRDEAGPASLKAFETAIEAVATRIRFIPDPP